MKAVGYRESLPIENPDALQNVEMERPVAKGRDLLVRVKAIAVNPCSPRSKHWCLPAKLVL